jgi:hypothetical protein
VAHLHLVDPLHHPLHLLIPSRGVLFTRSSAGDGNYTLLVECVVASKNLADVMEQGVEVGGFFGEDLECCMLLFFDSRREKSRKRVVYTSQRKFGSNDNAEARSMAAGRRSDNNTDNLLL